MERRRKDKRKRETSLLIIFCDIYWASRLYEIIEAHKYNDVQALTNADGTTSCREGWIKDDMECNETTKNVIVYLWIQCKFQQYNKAFHSFKIWYAKSKMISSYLSHHLIITILHIDWHLEILIKEAHTFIVWNFDRISWRNFLWSDFSLDPVILCRSV